MTSSARRRWLAAGLILIACAVVLSWWRSTPIAVLTDDQKNQVLVGLHLPRTAEIEGLGAVLEVCEGNDVLLVRIRMGTGQFDEMMAQSWMSKHRLSESDGINWPGELSFWIPDYAPQWFNKDAFFTSKERYSIWGGDVSREPPILNPISIAIYRSGASVDLYYWASPPPGPEVAGLIEQAGTQLNTTWYGRRSLWFAARWGLLPD